MYVWIAPPALRIEARSRPPSRVHVWVEGVIDGLDEPIDGYRATGQCVHVDALCGCLGTGGRARTDGYWTEGRWR